MKLVFVILAVVACASASVLPLDQSLTISQPLWDSHGWAGSSWGAQGWTPEAAWAAPAATWTLPAEGQYLGTNLDSVSSLNLQTAW